MFTKLLRRKKKRIKFDFEKAEDVEKIVSLLLKKLPFDYITPEAVYSVRSQGSKARAYARIWGLSRVFQIAAGYKPVYVIEVLAKYYDKLPYEEKVKVIIHELLHIPKTFSGALKSHHGLNHAVDKRTVDQWYKLLKK